LYHLLNYQVKAAETHWVYAALVVFGRMIAWINIYPAVYKGKIMLSNSGNIRSNPFIYKQIGDHAVGNVIIFDEEGDVRPQAESYYTRTQVWSSLRASH
jgi:hypothetical protein